MTGITARKKVSTFLRVGDGATSQTRWRRRNFSEQGKDGATFQTKAEAARLRKNSSETNRETAQFSLPRRGRLRWIRQLSRSREFRRGFSDQGGGGATKKYFLAIEVYTTRLLRPARRLRDFPDQRGEGATFQATAGTARFYGPNFFETDVDASGFSQSEWRRRNFPDQGGDDATKKQFFAT